MEAKLPNPAGHANEGDWEIDVAGERLALLPERAAYWPAANTLFVADLHVGKAATLRAHHVPIPPGSTSHDLERLSDALDRTGAERLVVLGDLFHARAGRIAERTLDRIADWRMRHAQLDLLLVRGNHDVHAGDPPETVGFTVVAEPFEAGPFVLRHHPHKEPDGYVLSGHIHPAAALRGRGRDNMRLPCFWFGERVGVLPAFGGLTGSVVVKPAPGDQVCVVVDGAVACVSG